MEKRIKGLESIRNMSIVMLVISVFVVIGSVLLSLGLIPWGEQRADGSYINEDLTIMDYPLAISGIVVLSLFGFVAFVIQIIILVRSIMLLSADPKGLSLATGIIGLFGAGLITLILSIVAITKEKENDGNNSEKVTTY